jgi:hypothetical protein
MRELKVPVLVAVLLAQGCAVLAVGAVAGAAAGEVLIQTTNNLPKKS